MKKWFDEKSTQLDTDSLVAFGIPLSTRYGRASEMVEMINFAQALAEAGLERNIKRVFYDSKADLCDIEFHDSNLRYTDTDEAMLRAAKETIGQFTWHGMVQHGRPLAD